MDSLLNNDTLTLILQLLDDHSLGRLLQVCRKFGRLTTELFWQQRSEVHIGLLSRYRKVFPSWRELYLGCREASYAVITKNWTSLHSNIRDAYREFIRVVSWSNSPLLSLPIERANEISQYEGSICNTGHLYILFPDRQVRADEDIQLLMRVFRKSHGRFGFVISDRLIEMPTLRKGCFFYNEVNVKPLSLLFFEILRLTAASVDQLQACDKLMAIKVDDNSFFRCFTPRRENYFLSPESPVLVIDKIKGRFMMAIWSQPDQEFDTIENQETGDRWTAFDETSCPIRYHQELEWEPIENLKNYPVLMS